MNRRIAVLEGDGIGPEIMREGLKVLSAVEKKYGHRFEIEKAPFGAAAYFSTGSSFPDQTKEVCDRADAIMKGPVGLAVQEMERIPLAERPEKAAILPLRSRYDAFANYRPVVLKKEFAEFSPLKPEVIGDGLDILMIRELVGGIYFGDKVEGEHTEDEYSHDSCVYNRMQVLRIARVAFREATRHNNHLVNVHKANVLATSRFWNSIVDEVHEEFPDVRLSSVLVDNAAYQLVKNPVQYNGVMLLENMQGDILTDEAGGVLGSLGLMPSASIGESKGYVEPAHGSAPDIAGKNIANPYSMIGSMALMLEKLFLLEKEARAVWDALTGVFSSGFRTRELTSKSTPEGKILSTTGFGDMVVELLEKA
ncbi:MAG: 3-isopropylmalate dehydrogenase [Spirochaetaceae bacterium]|nr:MAG: 3-isopropylmalate dehydrogenase [Spirochaetaceae bacterium]